MKTAAKTPTVRSAQASAADEAGQLSAQAFLMPRTALDLSESKPLSLTHMPVLPPLPADGTAVA